jgi:superfamily I DNA/RNA helicase
VDLPNLNDLIDEQFMVYDQPPDQHLFVAGPPGSGKTSLAVMRAVFLRNKGLDIVLITRNKLLAELGKQLGSDEIETSTLSSFIWHAHKDNIGKEVPQFVQYEYDWDKIMANYAALNFLPVLDHLIIDEGQNLPAGFFQWAYRYGAKNLTVFADEDQTTDAQRSSLKEIRDAGLPAPIRLKANHRNTAEIADVAEHFHRAQKLPPGVVQRGRGGELPRLVAIKKWSELASLAATRFTNRNEAIGIIVYLQADVLFLQQTLLDLLPSGTRVDAYVSKIGAAGGIRLLQPGITILSSESAIGLEFHTVYLQDLWRSLPCSSLDDFRRMYMLCARARNNLILIDGPNALAQIQINALPGPELLER